jgi:hypothetical protein
VRVAQNQEMAADWWVSALGGGDGDDDGRKRAEIGHGGEREGGRGEGLEMWRRVEEWTGREGGRGPNWWGTAWAARHGHIVRLAEQGKGEGRLTSGMRPQCQAAALADRQARVT